METRHGGSQPPALARVVAGRARPFAQHRDRPAAQHDLTLPTVFAPLPAVARTAVVEAMEAGETGYTARTGIEPLRRAISERSSADGFPATPETTVVTNGASEALFIILQTLVNPGGRVGIVDPVDPAFADLVSFVGGSAETISPGAAGIEGMSLLVISAASGISGESMPEDSLIDTLDAATAAGVPVVVDRSGAPDCYEPAAEFSRPDLAGQIMTVGSFSGLLGLAGWRAGYFTATEATIAGLAGLKESMSISTTTPTQYAMLAVLEQQEDVLRSGRTFATARRDMVTTLLESHNIPFRQPDVFPGLLIAVDDDDRAAGSLLRDHGVRVEPASRYGDSLAGHVRIDIRADDAALNAGIQRIATYLNEEAR